MAAMDRDPGLQSVNSVARWRYVVATGSLALAAACTTHHNATETPPRANNTVTTTFSPNTPSPTAELSAGPVVTPTESPSPTTTSSLEKCNSIRAARPGAYFNEGYKGHIDEQLHTMRVALSPNANTDINSDFVPWVAMSHAMEDDPEYSDAMARAYDMLKKDPSTPLTAETLLSWPIAPPPTCAPQRLTDAASRKNLLETREVSGAVFHGLMSHLGGQTARLFKPFVDEMQQQWQQFDKKLQHELQGL